MKNIKEVELFLFDMDGTVYIGDREIRDFVIDTVTANNLVVG